LSSHFVEIIKSILESYWHFGEKEKSKLETVSLEKRKRDRAERMGVWGPK